MIKKIHIKPINVPEMGTGKYLTVILKNFRLLSGKVNCYYFIGDGEKKLLDGEIEIPKEVLAKWNGDDMVLVNFVAESQMLDIIEIEEVDDTPKASKRIENIIESLTGEKNNLKKV